MAGNETAGRWDNRTDFFYRCAEYTKEKVQTGEITLQPGKNPTPWKCGCGWDVAALGDFYKKNALGGIVLAVEEDSRYVRNAGEIEYAVGVRYEFTKWMTPGLALRLLAFFDMAKEHPAVKNAGMSLIVKWHEQRRRYYNWHIYLNAPVCAVVRGTHHVDSLNNLPADWQPAFQRVVDAIKAQAKLVEQLRSEPLICTADVWKQLLCWYESNRQGVQIRELSAEQKEAVAPLIGKRVDELPAQFPAPLAFLSDAQDTPIDKVRIPMPDNEASFRAWLAVHVNASPKSQSRYLQALTSLWKNVPELFQERDITSVYEIETSGEIHEFIEELRETEWYRGRSERRPGVKPGGNDSLVILNHYCDFLNQRGIPAKTMSEKNEQKSERTEMELSLAALLQRPDREELLTGSKPVYLDCLWGRVEGNAWRPLYNLIWKMAWKEKREELVRDGSLVTPTNAEAYLRNTKLFFSVDETYAVYNNYGIRNMMPLIGKLFVVCGIALEDVKVHFVTNVETVSKTVTDADLNTILCGPPGTGKTYHTVAYAVAICMGRPVAEVMAAAKADYQSVKSEYNGLVQEGRIAFATFHQSYEYGDFIEGIRPEEKGGVVTYSVEPGVFRKFCDEAGDEPCVFIIDEINRGNISKILGELITLIEPSKRETQHVTLPLSGDDFTVPKNVYILGTMNTADRSIAMMDTALRRRFDFVPMEPRPELLPDNVEGVNVARMLEVMNKRIEWLYDADHAIGHALFWTLHEKPSLAELARIFRKKIIPQLQEYFHDDYGKVQLVLGRSPMIETCTRPDGLFMRSASEEVDLPDAVYHLLAEGVAAWHQAETYRAIYE